MEGEGVLWAAGEVLLEGEDPAEWRALRTQIERTLEPEGAIEEILVERIAGAAWRLRRLMRVEASLCRLGALGARLFHETGATYLRQLGLWEEHTPAPAEEGVLEGQSLVRVVAEPRALAELLRWEAAVDRVLYRALAELEARQRARRACEREE